MESAPGRAVTGARAAASLSQLKKRLRQEVQELRATLEQQQHDLVASIATASQPAETFA
jgi:hypothetical protein